MTTVPNTPTDLERVGPGTDNTPLFQANISSDQAGQEIKARFEILVQSAEKTLLAEDGRSLVTEAAQPILTRIYEYFSDVDSNFRTTAGTVEAEFGNALAPGVYAVRAKTISASGLESPYTLNVVFLVTQIVISGFNIFNWNVRILVLVDPVTKIRWNVTIAGERVVVLRWNEKAPVLDDRILKWINKTPWTEVDYNEDIWKRVY